MFQIEKPGKNSAKNSGSRSAVLRRTTDEEKSFFGRPFSGRLYLVIINLQGEDIHLRWLDAILSHFFCPNPYLTIGVSSN
jgi:hypothetical protein